MLLSHTPPETIHPRRLIINPAGCVGLFFVPFVHPRSVHSRITAFFSNPRHPAARVQTPSHCPNHDFQDSGIAKIDRSIGYPAYPLILRIRDQISKHCLKQTASATQQKMISLPDFAKPPILVPSFLHPVSLNVKLFFIKNIIRERKADFSSLNIAFPYFQQRYWG